MDEGKWKTFIINNKRYFSDSPAHNGTCVAMEEVAGL